MVKVEVTKELKYKDTYITLIFKMNVETFSSFKTCIKIKEKIKQKKWNILKTL
jgi:hypothetical protein